jgi:putative polyketide hydroxylase
LHRGNEELSTIDLTGKVLLLVGSEGSEWQEVAARAADGFGGIRLDVQRVGSGISDPEGRLPQAFGISSRGASLIRPDGFVAWRSVGASPQRAQDLHEALGRLLGY